MAKEEREMIITPEFRMAFPAILEPEEFDDGGKKYSLTMLFPKEEDISDLKRIAAAAVKAKWPSGKPKGLKSPFSDGDEVEWDGYAGCTYCKAGSKFKPGLVDAELKPIIDPEKVYGGCYARAQINAFAYETKGNKGVSFGLENVQIIRDGDPFGSKQKAEEAFSAFGDSTGGDADDGMFD